MRQTREQEMEWLPKISTSSACVRTRTVDGSTSSDRCDNCDSYEESDEGEAVTSILDVL